MTPPLARLLGFAGLLPQLACALAKWFGSEEWRWTALAMGWAYAALIFSFLGGLWWGLATAALARGAQVPHWLWLAAIAPSLLALLTYSSFINKMELQPLQELAVQMLADAPVVNL